MLTASGRKTSARLAAFLMMLSTASCATRPTECSWSIPCDGASLMAVAVPNGDPKHDAKVRKLKEDCALQNRGYRRYCQ